MRTRLIDVVVPAVLLSCMIGTFVVQARAEDWPQFRGPNATGIAAESTHPPVTFSTTENVRWSVPLGPGVACPIVVAGRVHVTSMSPDGQFVVAAYDAVTGAELWSTTFDPGPLPEITPPNEPASSTPAGDGERVYVHLSTRGLLALDAKTGSPVWEHKLPPPFYLMGWGAANSPIVFEDLVIFNLDDDLAPYLVAVDKRTGEQRWKTERPDVLGGYAVPVLCTANGRTDVVVAGSGRMQGYDPRTGREIWTCNSLVRTIMTTPVVQGDRIYFAVQSVGDSTRVLKKALLDWRDTNQDGRLDKSEVDPPFHAKFDAGDANHDGVLVDEEIDSAFQSPGNRVGGGNIIQAIRGGGEGDVTQTHMLWKLDHQAPSNICSPLAYDGRLLLVKKGGLSAAFNLEDGAELWNKKRLGNLGNYYASPIAAGDRIYVPGENGFIVVLKAGPQPEVLAKNDVGNSLIATPAIADNRLYVRTYDTLWCFDDATP